MSYIKLEHRGLGSDRWLAVSPAAFTVHVWALDYCNEQATDGEIPETRALRLTCPVEPAAIPAALEELVGAGIWERTERGYSCPEFLAYGIAATEQEATRDKWATDKRRQRLHNVGNHQLCTPKSCKAVPSRQVDSDPDVHQWTSGRSDQTRPDQTPTGFGEGRGAAGEAAASAGCGRCAEGWLGEDRDGRPIPCPTCKPHLRPKEEAC